MNRGPRGSGSGFALPEVLVGLVVFSVGALGVAAMALSVAEHTRRAAWETGATLAAQQVADSVRAAPDRVPGSGLDTVAGFGREWRVSWEVRPDGAGLLRLDARVAGRAARHRTFSSRLSPREAWFGSAGTPPTSGGGVR